MEKIILVFNIDIGNIDPQDVNGYINKFASQINPTLERENILGFFVPVYQAQQNKIKPIECLNPKLISDNEYKQIKNKLEKYNSLLDSLLNENQNK